MEEPVAGMEIEMGYFFKLIFNASGTMKEKNF